MIFRDGNINELLACTEKKKLVCYGAGRHLRWLCELFASFNFVERIDYVADTNAEKLGSVFCYSDTVIPIGTLEQYQEQNTKEFVLLITSHAHYEILSDLQDRVSLQGVVCYVGAFMENYPPTYSLPNYDPIKDKLLIPKVIHYCWFGGKPIPPQFKKYIESWRKFCPDYEIVEWNESNYDVKQNRYMYEAYQEKKWGFVPDYARLDIIYKYGGVYLDTDVELIKPIDRFLCESGFCGMEAMGIVALGLAFGAVAGHELIREWMDNYNTISFFNMDGTLNLTASPIYQTDALADYGLLRKNHLQRIRNMTIYPTDVFCPIRPMSIFRFFTENTHAIHHYAASWLDKEKVKENEILNNKRKTFLAQLST